MMLPLPYRRFPAQLRGFTLVELLTVIAIIGVLAAILIPTVGRVRESAKASVCASNLRQLSMACLLYAGENGGRLVALKDGTTGETWRIKIESYLMSRRAADNVLICPSDSVTVYLVSSATGEWPNSYGMNPAAQFVGSGTLLEYSAGTRSQRLAAVKTPGRFIMLTDIGRNTSGGGGADPATWTEDRTATSVNYGYARLPWGGAFNQEWSVWGRHGGGTKTNASFYDGHVASLDLVADLKNHPNGDPLCMFDNH